MLMMMMIIIIIIIIIIISCARGDTVCLRPLQVDNIFVFIRQVAPVPARWLFKTSATSWHLTFWPWKWCVRVTCDVHFCASFSLHRPLCSRVRTNVSDKQTSDVRQTDRRQTKASLNVSATWGRSHNNNARLQLSRGDNSGTLPLFIYAVIDEISITVMLEVTVTTNRTIYLEIYVTFQ